MTIALPRSVIRTSRDLQIPPETEKSQSRIWRELVSQKSSNPKPLGNDHGILQLPGRLFSSILTFLSPRDHDAISISSRRADANRWNAYILTNEPEAYCFYQKIMEKEKPCKRHWNALCETLDKFSHLQLNNLPLLLDHFVTFNNSQFTISLGKIIEPFPHLVIRDAFPQYSVVGLNAIKLAEHLQGEPFKVRQQLSYKLSRGFCLNGMLGTRHFWVIGEEHHKQDDVDFVKLALQASEKTIALFLETDRVSDEEDPLFKKVLGVSSQSIVKGLDSSDGNPKMLQVFSSLLLNSQYSDISPSKCLRLFLECASKYSNIIVLNDALTANIEHFPKYSCLAQTIFDAINWESLKIGHILSSQKIDEICEIAETNRDSLLIFLYILGKCLEAEPQRFTKHEHQIFKEALDSRTLKTALQCAHVFRKKRDVSFAENFLRELPTIPPSKPIIAVLGAAHQWQFFSMVMSGYYQHPEKYAFKD